MGTLEVSVPLRGIPVNPGVLGVMGDLECGLLWLPLMSIALNERYYNCLNMEGFVFTCSYGNCMRTGFRLQPH